MLQVPLPEAIAGSANHMEFSTDGHHLAVATTTGAVAVYTVAQPNASAPAGGLALVALLAGGVAPHVIMLCVSELLGDSAYEGWGTARWIVPGMLLR